MKESLFLIASSVACIIGVVTSRAFAQGYEGMSLPADFPMFSDASPWNTPIPADAPIDPTSDLMMTTMQTVLDLLGSPSTVNAALYQWTTPIHVIDSTKAPRIDIPGTSVVLSWTVDPDQDGIAQNIPMPIEAWQDPETDGNMTLIDPDRMLAWELSEAEPLGGGQWRASAVEHWDLNGPGWRPPFVGPSWWAVGSIASGMPFFAGVVRVEEIQAGVIDHALIVSCPSNRDSTVPGGDEPELCFPAMNSDGWGVGPQFIPEGARLQLDPDLDLDALGLSEHAKTVARAMQEYGVYVGLNGPGFAIYFQNLGPTGGAWNSVADVFDIINVPVSAFRVLECDTVAKDGGGGAERSVDILNAPGNAIVGHTLAPVSVQLVDAAGTPVFTGREFDVTVRIGMWEGTNPGGAELLGTTTKRTVNGVAEFDDLVVDRPGDGYRLFAMPVDLNHAVTAPFNVRAPGDVDGDGAVDFVDLSAMLASWGPCPSIPSSCPADFTGDDFVSLVDLLVLLSNFSSP